MKQASFSGTLIVFLVYSLLLVFTMTVYDLDDFVLITIEVVELLSSRFVKDELFCYQWVLSFVPSNIVNNIDECEWCTYIHTSPSCPSNVLTFLVRHHVHRNSSSDTRIVYINTHFVSHIIPQRRLSTHQSARDVKFYIFYKPYQWCLHMTNPDVKIKETTRSR